MNIKLRAVDSQKIYQEFCVFWHRHFEKQFESLPKYMQANVVELQLQAKIQSYFVQHPKLTMLKIKIHATDIGCMLLALENDALHIIDLIIKEEFRGKGFGKAAVEQAIAIAKAKDISVIKLSPAIENNAKALYKAFGMSVTEYGDKPVYLKRAAG